MKDVLVVVGVGGMGEAIARRTGSGHRVLLADFNEDLLGNAASRLRDSGFEIETRKVDVSSRESVRDLAHAAADLGPVTRVAHTAGLSPVQAPTPAILRVDLVGVAYSLEEFGEVVAPGGSGVVIASIGGNLNTYDAETEQALRTLPADELLTLPYLQQRPDLEAHSAYGFAKRANQLRVQGAAAAWGARGARVNTVSPGIISTPMAQQELSGPSGESMRAMVASSGTKRMGTTSDIADAVAFLFGPESTFITGTDLLVDGGVVAAIRTGTVAENVSPEIRDAMRVLDTE